MRSTTPSIGRAYGAGHRAGLYGLGAGLCRLGAALCKTRGMAPRSADDGTAAMKAFNDLVAADDRVEAMIIPIGDGLAVARIHPAP